MNITIDAIFNILNLLLRIGLVIFVIRKYVIRRIMQALLNEQQETTLLVEQQTELRESCGNLERSMKDQEQLYEDLQAKFVIWQCSVQKKLDQQRIACAVQQENLQAQLEKKQTYVQQKHIIDCELPGLLQESAQKLQQQFGNDKALGKAYITKVLHALKES